MSDLSSLANTSVVNYVSFCLIFFVLKYRYFASDKYSWIFVFFIIACILQFVNNLYLSSLPSFCGSIQLNISLYATLMPWIIIFGSFCLCLFIFPGWLRAFSNTFGLKAAQMYGIEDVVNKIFLPDERSKVVTTARQNNNIDLLRAIESIYSGKTVFVNELKPDDFQINPSRPGADGLPVPETYSWPSLTSLIDSGIVTSIKQEDMKELYENILLKDTVGHFIWFLLIGSLTVLVSTNTLLNSGCSTETGNYNAIFN